MAVGIRNALFWNITPFIPIHGNLVSPRSWVRFVIWIWGSRSLRNVEVRRHIKQKTPSGLTRVATHSEYLLKTELISLTFTGPW